MPSVEDGLGDTLTYDATSLKYTYTGHDGTIAVYDTALADRFSAAFVASVTYADGVSQNYYYKQITSPVLATFLSSVINNLGYQIKFNLVCSPGCTGEVSQVFAINNAVEWCDPNATSCSPTNTWPTVTHSNGAGGPGCPSGVFWTKEQNSDGQSLKTCSTCVDLGCLHLRKWVIQSSGRELIYDFGYDFWLNTYTVYQVTDGSNASQHWYYSIAPDTGTGDVTDPLGHVQAVDSYPDGSLKDVDIDPSGLGLTTTYYRATGSQLVTRVVLPEGNAATNSGEIDYAYDSRANVITSARISNTPGTPSNIVRTATFPSTCTDVRSCNKPTSTTDANGRQTDYTYDAASGNLATITGPADANGNRPQTRYNYTAKIAWYKQDATGVIMAAPTPVYRLTSVSSCLVTSPGPPMWGSVSWGTFNWTSSVSSCTGTAQEQIVETNYTSGSSSVPTNLQPSSVTIKAGDNSVSSGASYTYDDYGNVAQVTGPSGAQTEIFYNLSQQVTGVINEDPDGSGSLLHPATRTTYDTDGRVTLVEQGTTTGTDMSSFSSINQAGFDYDATFRAPKVKQTTYLGGLSYPVAVTQYSYDLAYNPLCTAARNDTSTFGSLPGACTYETPSGNGPDQIIYNTYDAANRLLSITAGYGSGVTTTVSKTWTPNSNVATITDGNGNTSTYTYDGLDRLSQIALPDVGTNPGDVESYDYDPNGNMLHRYLRNSGGTIAYTYDSLNRLIGKNLPSGPVTQYRYRYDLLGDLTAAYEGSTGTTGLTYVYDALQRKLVETSYGHAITSAYDAAGNRTCLTYPDGHYVLYGYDALDRMKTVRQGNATACSATSASSLASYDYDDQGRVTAITRPNGADTSASYDANDPNWTLAQGGSLSPAVSFGISYTPAQQVSGRSVSNSAYAYGVSSSATTPYCPNTLNQYAVVGGSGPGCTGGTSFSYDGQGNLTSDGSRSFSYDSENHLTGASGTSLNYDPSGRMAQEGATRFLYDGNTLVAEYDASGNVLRRYVPGAGTDETLVWYEGSGLSTPMWLHTDQQGSVVAASNASGTATPLAYDADGRPTAWGAIGSDPRLRYTGQAALPDLQLYYYKARMYDPTLGRFLQTDPAGYSAGQNLYAYANNDPVNNSDPSGLTSACQDAARGGSPHPDAIAGVEDISVVGNCSPDDYGFVWPPSLSTVSSPLVATPNVATPTRGANGHDPVALCESEAYLALVGNLTLDALGLIPGEDAVATVVRLGAMSLQGANLALEPKVSGGLLFAGSFGREMAGAAYSSRAAKIALTGMARGFVRSLPLIGAGWTALSALNDIKDYYKRVQACHKVR
ncbi:MAG: hypothetical protein JO256_13500 [Alphaproteobacteria bacterium]|nr:hypothetical protein [Alphaproteobacteria bacterium]